MRPAALPAAAPQDRSPSASHAGRAHGPRGAGGRSAAAASRMTSVSRATGSRRPPTVVGLSRFERLTSPLSGVRSNQLSYRPLQPVPDRERPESLKSTCSEEHGSEEPPALARVSEGIWGRRCPSVTPRLESRSLSGTDRQPGIPIQGIPCCRRCGIGHAPRLTERPVVMPREEQKHPRPTISVPHSGTPDTADPMPIPMSGLARVACRSFP